jgi:hypothetical protein
VRKTGKVVVMYAGSADGRRPTEITQYDLTEEKVLREQALDAMRAFQAKRDMIRRALEAGAIVEPGARRARIRIQRSLVTR